VRSVTETSRKLIEQRIRDIVDNITKSNGATYKLDYFRSYSAIQNDSTLVDFARASAVKAVSTAQVFEAPSMTASEDFSYYHEVAPVCFLNLGVGPGVANHNPKFNPDESALANGVKVQVQLILDFLRMKTTNK
jgi:metal-dependent amidase/aminoacylase/carboxypeptidase family protein